MGGIAGILSRTGAPVSYAILQQQSQRLAQRGHASAAIWTQGPLGLVHRSSGIAPPVCPGAQPIVDPTGRYYIVCNGRIFNAPELARRMPDARGMHDGAPILQVMLTAYLEWGVGAFAHFNGAFACAIWDATSKHLILARDQFGLKPLFYYADSEVVVFGSEAKAVIVHPRCRAQPDDAGIVNYLTFNRYLYPSATTFYRDVKRLALAQVLHVRGTQASTQTYWAFDATAAESRATTPADVDEITELVTDAVRIRLPAPPTETAAALTGGYDSSSIVGLLRMVQGAHGASTRPLQTFSWDFGTPDADELDLINVVAQAAGAQHHHLPAVTATMFDDLDALLAANDGPVLESSVLLLWQKKRAIRQAGMGVQLSGCGGDEVFLGTMHYFADLVRRGRWRDFYAEITSVYPLDLSTGKPTRMLELLRSYVVAPLMPRYLRRLLRSNSGRFYPTTGRRYPPRWVANEIAAKVGLDAPPDSDTPRFSTAYSQFSFDLLWYDMLACYVQYHEVASSAFGLETRFPFLDIRLVERMFALPRECKVRRGEVRVMQRQALAHVIPDIVRQAHLKKNFHPSLHRLSRTMLLEQLAPLIQGARQLSRPYFNWPVLMQHYDMFRDREGVDPAPLWGFLNVERWLRKSQFS